MGVPARKTLPMKNTTLICTFVFFFPNAPRYSPKRMPEFERQENQPAHMFEWPPEYKTATMLGQMMANA